MTLHTLALAFALGMSPLAAPPPEKQAAEDPAEALALAIKLLEAKDYAGYVKRLYPPEDLAKELKEHGIDGLVQMDLGRGKSERLLRDLKLVKGATPVYNEKRTSVTFSAKEAGGRPVSVRFILRDGKWYIA
jgi:hypothetical protein